MPEILTAKSPLWKYVVVLWLLIVTFPGDYQAIRPGLDASWVHALNYLTQTDLVFGQDFVHPYGPLGYLIHPLNIGSNILHAISFRLVIHSIFASCLFIYAHRAKNALPILVFAIGYALSLVAVITLEFSYQLLVVEALIFCVSLTDKRLWWIAAPLCGALAASILFMKFGIGITGAAILASATVIWILTEQREAWKVVLVVGGSYLAVIALLTAVYLGSVHNLLIWIERSLSMSDGYTVAQSLLGQRRFLVLGLLAVAVYAWTVFLLHKQKSKLRYVAPVFALAVFLAFKHGFVQGHGHERNFFPFLLAAISLLALNMTTRKDFKTVTISFLLVLALSAPVGAHYAPKSRLPPAYQTLLGKTGILNIASAVTLERTRTRLDLEGAKNLASRPLPSAWIDEIREANGTVDVIPWELSYALADNLQWVPNATIQIFNSFTPLLDQWNAQHYMGNRSPDFLIVEFVSIDNRHLLLDTPAITRSILRNYAIHREELGRNLVLLKKRSHPVPEDRTVIAEKVIHPDEWIAIPPSDHLLFAHMDFSLSPFGHFSKVLFRIPPAYVDAVYESGREVSYRVTLELAADGLMLNYLPANEFELVDFLNGCAADRVIKFRVSGPGTQYYRQDAALRWEQSVSPLRISQKSNCAS